MKFQFVRQSRVGPQGLEIIQEAKMNGKTVQQSTYLRNIASERHTLYRVPGETDWTTLDKIKAYLNEN